MNPPRVTLNHGRPRTWPRWDVRHWLGNDDDPTPPGFTSLSWFLRNPLHNFAFYVIGVADRDSVTSGTYPDRVFPPKGARWNRTATTIVVRGFLLSLPFLAYRGTRWRSYIGWRPPQGAFGIKLQRERDDT